MATITNSNPTSESCNNNYNIVISVMTVAIIVTILHIFVPQLGGNFFAIISIILLLVSSLFSANAGWQQYLSNRNTNDHDNIKKGIFRNAILSGVLAFILAATALMMIIRTLE